MKAIGSLCVYCGAAAGIRPTYAEAARQLGRAMAERGIRLVYGGGRIGLMGIIADSVLAAGGEAIGILPTFLRRVEQPHSGLHELRIVDSMHERKQMMFEMSDAFAIMPGGFGTLDETFEMVTWRQLALHDKPVVLVNVAGYWDPLLQMIAHAAAEGFIHGKRHLFDVAPDVDALFTLLAQAPEPTVADAPERT